MAKNTDINLKKTAPGAVVPEGWLLDRLLLAGELQKRLGAMPGLLKNGEWTEGETLPRYLRGLVLLAGALGERELMDKVERLVMPVLASANAGGDFGPKGARTLTPKIEAVKALLSYYELSGDKRIPTFLKKYFKNQFNTYQVTSCWYDSRARLLEEISALDMVYRNTDLEWMQDLGEKLRDSSNDWFKLANKFPYKNQTSKYVSRAAYKKVTKAVEAYEGAGSDAKQKPFTPDKIESEWKKQAHQTLVETKGVNLAKAVKYPVTYGRFVGDDELKNLSLRLIAAINKYHGTPTGMFGCDPYLSGGSPSRGIDVEAAVELLESLIEVLADTADAACADLIEKIVFNVIPAAAFADMGAVQDELSVNQDEASRTRTALLREGEYGTAFVKGKPNRGSIALLSAYPLYMQALLMSRGNELNFMTYAPCTIETVVDGCKIVIKEETGYPYRNTVIFSVKQAEGEPEVKINFRVPKNTTMQLISGGQAVASGTRNISVKCILRTGSTFMLKMDIPLVACDNRDGSVSLYKGSLLMASKLAYEITAESSVRSLNFTKKWNYAPVLSKKLINGVRRTYEAEQTVVHPFLKEEYSEEKPPFELKIRSKNVLNWEYDDDGYPLIPSSPNFSDESIQRNYVPFGCAKLRMAQFPKCCK